MFKNKKSVILIAIFCCLLWGSAFPVLKISYQELGLASNDYFGKIAFAGIRFFVASLLLFACSLLMKQTSVVLKKGEASKLLGLGFINTTLAYVFFYNGLANTSGIQAAILQSSSTFFVVILSHFVYANDKITGHKLIGLMLGFVGIAVANFTGGLGGSTFLIQGQGFMILSGFFGALGTIMAKNLGKTIQPFKVTLWQMGFGSLILLGIGFSQVPLNYFQFTPLSVALLIYAAFISATGFSLWFNLLKYNKASEITLYKFLIPIAGATFSAAFLKGETFSIYLLLGLVCVASGLFIVNKVK